VTDLVQCSRREHTWHFSIIATMIAHAGFAAKVIFHVRKRAE
jgi:hypothetical protein